jgi:hypothetical protein
MDINTALITLSVTLNIMAAWVWYRRGEILSTAIELRNAYKDNNVSEDEYQTILARMEAIFEKE